MRSSAISTAHGSAPAARIMSPNSAVQEVARTYNIPVISIGNLDDLFGYLNSAGADPQLQQHKDAVAAYRTRYGIA